jgi:prepilin-type N-terminal cleavage/methylation domain-containing protein
MYCNQKMKNEESHPEFISGSQKMPKLGTSQFRQVRHDNAFTLLEIMIALAIIGMTLMTVLHTANYHANLSNENTVVTQMTQLAKEKLYELEKSPSSSSGKIEGTDFTYENVLSETDSPWIIELKTAIKGKGQEVVLNEFVVRKTLQQP